MELTINQRITNLHNNHYKKLINYVTKITNSTEEAEDVYSNMIVFLIENQNEKIFEADSFNICYIYRILYSRAINRINFLNKKNSQELTENITIEDDEYNYEADKLIEDKLDLLLKTVNELKDKNIDKYFNYYIKYYLYKTPVKLCSSMAGVSKNTLYSHFRKIQEVVVKEMKEKILSIDNKNDNK